MVEFKSKADEIIKERYGIDVEHVYAIDKKLLLTKLLWEGNTRTYEKQFYSIQKRVIDTENISTVSQRDCPRGAIYLKLPHSSAPKLTYEKVFYHIPKEAEEKLI